MRVALDIPALCIPLGLHSELVGPGPFQTPDNPLPPEFIHSLPPAGSSSYAYSPELPAWLDANLIRFDGVVLHGLWTHPTWGASQKCRQRGIPYAHFTHGMLEPWSVHGQGLAKSLKKRIYWYLRERSVCANARSLLCTTQREARLAHAMFNLHAPVTVLPPAGFPAPREPSAQPRRPDLIQPDGLKIALFLGRVHPKKNLEFLLRAWSQAAPGPGWRLLVAGPVDSAYQPTLTNLIRQLRLEDQVHFTGFVSSSDRAYLFQRAEWFLLPSLQENFGVAVLEAVSQNCAVAISDRVYLAESFRPESEIIPLDLERWTQFLRTRMTDSAWRAQTASADRSHLLQFYEINHVAATWVSTFQRLLA